MDSTEANDSKSPRVSGSVYSDRRANLLSLILSLHIHRGKHVHKVQPFDLADALEIFSYCTVQPLFAPEYRL